MVVGLEDVQEKPVIVLHENLGSRELRRDCKLQECMHNNEIAVSFGRSISHAVSRRRPIFALTSVSVGVMDGELGVVHCNCP